MDSSMNYNDQSKRFKQHNMLLPIITFDQLNTTGAELGPAQPQLVSLSGLNKIFRTALGHHKTLLRL